MSSLRSMRLRMRSVKNIAQVTRALEAVSASKVRRAQEAAVACRPYSEQARLVLQHVMQCVLQETSAAARLPLLLRPRPVVRRILLVLITSNRGLCGAYNTNVVRAALNFADGRGAPAQFIAVGAKGRDWLRRWRRPLVADFSSLPGLPSFLDVVPVGRLVMDEFLAGQVDEVHVAYTQFINTIKQEPRVFQLLPVPEVWYRVPAAAAFRAVFTYEPSAEDVLDYIAPHFTEQQLYQAVLEALAGEHSARMVAMRNATDNANDLLNNLQLTYNKARQLSITSDLLDISGGVEALAQAEA